MSGCRRATGSFQGRRRFVKLGLFNKYFVENTSKKYYHFQCKILPKEGHNKGFFSLQNQSIFSVLKRGQGRPAPLPPLNILEKCLHNVLTMLRLWMYLVILYVRQALEEASGFKCVRVFNMVRLYMQGLQRVDAWCLNIAQYASIMPKYTSLCLNAPQYAWTWLNIAECLWISLTIPE